MLTLTKDKKYMVLHSENYNNIIKLGYPKEVKNDKDNYTITENAYFVKKINCAEQQDICYEGSYYGLYADKDL